MVQITTKRHVGREQDTGWGERGFRMLGEGRTDSKYNLCIYSLVPRLAYNYMYTIET